MHNIAARITSGPATLTTAVQVEAVVLFELNDTCVMTGGSRFYVAAVDPTEDSGWVLVIEDRQDGTYRVEETGLEYDVHPADAVRKRYAALVTEADARENMRSAA